MKRAFVGTVLGFAILGAVLSVGLWRVVPGSALLIVQLVIGVIPLPLGIAAQLAVERHPERALNLATAAMLVEAVWLAYFLVLLIIPGTWGPDDLYS